MRTRSGDSTTLTRVCQGWRRVPGALAGRPLTPPPPHRLAVRLANDATLALQMRQVAQRLLEKPRGVGLGERLPWTSPAIATASLGSAPSAPRVASSRSATSSPRPLDVTVDVHERPPVARQAEPGVQPVDDIRASRGTRRPGRGSSRSRSTARSARAHDRRRSGPGAPAGYRQTWEGAWPGVSYAARCRGRSRSDPVHERPVGLDHPRDPRRHASWAEALGVPLEHRRWYAALAADLEAPGEHGLGIRAAPVACRWFGCIHSSHPARSMIGAAWPQ